MCTVYIIFDDILDGKPHFEKQSTKVTYATRASHKATLLFTFFRGIRGMFYVHCVVYDKHVIQCS